MLLFSLDRSTYFSLRSYVQRVKPDYSLGLLPFRLAHESRAGSFILRITVRKSLLRGFFYLFVASFAVFLYLIYILTWGVTHIKCFTMCDPRL